MVSPVKSDPAKSDTARAPRKAGRCRTIALATTAVLTLGVAACTEQVAGSQAQPSTAQVASSQAGQSTAPVASSQVGQSTADVAGSQVQRLIDKALAQVGDQYVFGAEVSETDPDPSVWDSAELTQWSAYQVGSTIPDSSFEQYLDLKAKGLLIPVDQGVNTPGALLFHFSSEPQPGGGRPDEAFVALSLGGGRTVEAQSEAVGVVTDDADGRFEYAALLPDVDYSG